MTQSTTIKGLAVLAIAVVTAVPGYSFTSKGVITKKAKATLTAQGTATLDSVIVKALSNNAVATDIAWSNAAVGNWKVADHYLEISAVTSAAGSGVQIWTDNINGTAPDKSTLTPEERVTITPAGLVDNSNPKKSIPLAWSIKQSSAPFTAIDPNAESGDSYFWHFTADKGSLNNPATPTVNEAYVDGADYQTVQNPSGIHFGGRPIDYGAASNPKFIFLQADFRSASTPNAYGTTTLTLEAFTN